MNWHNVKLILGREVRDQLRDRRTLFMIAVLPVLLYPLLGMSALQLAQFLNEHPTRVLVIGATELARMDEPPRLFDPNGRQFDKSLFAQESSAALLELTFAREDELELKTDASPEELTEATRHEMRERRLDAVIVFPPDFLDRLDMFRGQLRHRGSQRKQADAAAKSSPDKAQPPAMPADAVEQPHVPNPIIFYNTTREASQQTRSRLDSVLQRWMTKVGEQNLVDSDLPKSTARPFSPQANDVAETGRKDVVTWAKILPFVLMIWALTGAFYPAVDLCAGEKERGTLETLLCSPAQRSEIVVGKLLTVMLFSMATAVLNIASMGLTGTLLFSVQPQLANAMQLGVPPALAMLWLAIALVPVSALFGALSVALASFARSSKEGQYYLMPLILVTMPLAILPMSPSVELTWGNSLIPVTGLMLLLRELVLGNYAFALLHAGPVVAVTLGCCYFAIRWAIDQFSSESVLFRESERLDLGLWLRHLRADRPDTPTASMAMMCGMLILLIRFFAGISIPAPRNANELLVWQAITLVAFVAAPALIAAVVLTRRPRQTLLLRVPNVRILPLAALLAVAFHPVAITLNRFIAWLYPFDTRVLSGLTEMLGQAPLGWVLVVFALLPALCEETAFRGFILSGMREMGHPWRAILVSSAFFGVTHFIVQQSITAAIVGVLIGYLAVRTGSLLTGVVFHATHNALLFLLPSLAEAIKGGELESWLFADSQSGESLYRMPIVLAGAIAATGIVLLIRRLTHATEAPLADDDLSDFATQPPRIETRPAATASAPPH